MTGRGCGEVLGLLSLAGAALGQPLETVTISIDWDKPVIQHGETNTGKVIATVSPKIGDTVAWNTAPGTGQAATLLAFRRAILDLVGVENAANGSLEWTIPGKWNTPLEPGTLTPEGGIKDMWVMQPGGPVDPNPDTSQAPTICLLEWKETNGGEAYDVLFESKLALAQVFIDVGFAAWIGENCVKIDEKGGFSVVPGPGAWVVVFGATLALRRRR